MKIKKNKNKFRKLRERYFSSKAGVLFVLNRKIKTMVGLGDNFGKLTDLELDRQQKNLTLEVTYEKEVNNISIHGYGFTQRKGEPYLVWEKMKFDGPESENYRKRFKSLDGIELSKRYISVVEAIL